MGFFSKIFGGGKKSDSREIKTVSGEQPAVPEEKAPAVSAPSPEPVTGEERVPEPELKDDAELSAPSGSGHKPTVFGMPAPPVVAGAAGVSGSVVAGEAVSGEVLIGESERRLEAASAEKLPDTASAFAESAAGEVLVGETVVESAAQAPASAEAPSAGEAEAAETAETAEAVETVEAVEAVEAAPAAPPPLPASETGEPRPTSGSLPAVVEDESADGNIELFSKAEKRDLRSSIECSSCRHRLPVPYVGYPARITCPFCLNVNEYNL